MRLIDADAMTDRLKEWDTKDMTDKALYNFTLNRINEQPTIQPEPSEECERCMMEHMDSMEELETKLAMAEPHWIPVEQTLPEEPFGCLVTVMDTNPMTMEEFENILPYFVGWDGEQWNDDDGEQCPFEVLAWWRLPEPYKGVTE